MIHIQQLTASTDGEQSQTWTDKYANICGRIMPASGREVARGRQIEATVSHVIEIGYRQGVTAEMRIVSGTRDRIFNITAAIDPTERKRKLELYCTEQAST